jgi:rubrerythrin
VAGGERGPEQRLASPTGPVLRAPARSARILHLDRRPIHDTAPAENRPEKETEPMSQLKGSKTHETLKAAFAGESQANRRYLYFAKQADVEGYPEAAGNFRDTAEGETGHAHGHLDYLRKVGDPATDLPIGDTASNLKAAVAGETHEYTDMYPGMAATAREEGFDEIADWFETLAKAEKSHAGKFQSMLESIS